MGWHYDGSFPKNIGNCVVIGAPHTSNWDFIPAMSLIYWSKLNAKFLIKAEWMFFPLNYILGAIGAVGVVRNKTDKNKNDNSIENLVSLFQGHKNMSLVMSPEGTRKANPKWKTGFFYIAKKANLPVVMAYADYATKTLGYSQPIYLTDLDSDMKKICEFYKDKTGKNPAQFALDAKYR